MKRLESAPGVKNVYVARTYSVPQPLSEGDGETTLFSQNSEVGEGTAVAVLDESFLVSHEYFGTGIEKPKFLEADVQQKIDDGYIKSGRIYSEKIPFSYDYADDDKDVNLATSLGHGTHVAGIVGGKNSEMSGAAPGCQLVLMKVFSDRGTASDTKILKAIDDAVKLGVDVMNLSFGSPSGFTGSAQTLSYDAVFQRARSAGITVCCSAGNNAVLGRKNNAVTDVGNYPTTDITDYGTLATPAIADSAVAVSGITYSPLKSEKYSIGYYSSWGASPELELKPDICAVGTSVKSSISSSQTSYGTKSGTSMASPFVAGSIAAIKEGVKSAHPLYDNVQTDRIARLEAQSSAHVLKDADGGILSPRAQGTGMIDVQSALQTPAVLYGDSGATKVDLYDNLGNSVTFDFYAENTGTENVTYNIEAFAVTDDYEEKDGKLFVNGKTREIEGSVFSFDCGTSVTVASGEKKKITASVSFDSRKLLELANAFPNGFFVEGYIFLSNNALPQLSIPFMGYMGSWASQCAVDGGELFGTTEFKNNVGTTCNIYNIEGKGNFISVKSGGSIAMTNVPILRNTIACTASFTDLQGNAAGVSQRVWTYGEKSFWNFGSGRSSKTVSSIALADAEGTPLPQGEYYYTLSFATEYKGTAQISAPYKMKTVIDDTPPQAVLSLEIEHDSVYTAVRATDNFAVHTIVTSAGTNKVDVAGEGVTLPADISGNIAVYDFSGNAAYPKAELKRGYVCHYGTNHELLDINVCLVPFVDGEPSVNIADDADRTLYIWENMKPI